MTIWLKLGVGLAALSIPAVLPQAGYAADAAHPTVVELFQSQRCSDCPPAAANVAAISDRPDVLALSFAVDYWDRLGWKDTFSILLYPNFRSRSRRWRGQASRPRCRERNTGQAASFCCAPT